MGAFDEMIGLGDGLQLTRRPLASLDGEQVEENEVKATSVEGGQRAKESDLGHPKNSFINKLLAAKFGHDSNPDPEAAAKRTADPA
jgi:hypothetical protein